MVLSIRIFLPPFQVFIDSVDDFKRPILREMVLAAEGVIIEQQQYTELSRDGKVDALISLTYENELKNQH